MSVPEVLASLAILCFIWAFAAYIIDDLKACGRVPTPTAGDGQDPRRTQPTTQGGVNSPGPSPAGVYDWQEEGWVA